LSKSGSRGGATEERAISQLEAEHPEGLTSAQIVDWFLGRGSQFSEATFRKWVQLGLLPRSRRVGRKGKHQGSLGLYPPSTVRRIAEVKRLMGENLTIEDIQRALRFRDQIEAVARELAALWAGFEREIAAPEQSTEARRELERALSDSKRHAGELVRRIEGLERRIVTPLVRAARSRAFGAGAGGGAGDLL
jgi:DNA-binding transcriptional MerR regulator